MPIIGAVILALVVAASAAAYPCSQDSPLRQVSFLAGQWVGDPNGQPVFQDFPGVLQSGDFTGQFEPGRWVLILRSRTKHQDMMVIHAGCGTGQAFGALYIDSSRHTVQHC